MKVIKIDNISRYINSNRRVGSDVLQTYGLELERGLGDQYYTMQSRQGQWVL